MHGQHIYYYSHSIINIYFMYATFLYVYKGHVRWFIMRGGGGKRGYNLKFLKKIDQNIFSLNK